MCSPTPRCNSCYTPRIELLSLKDPNNVGGPEPEATTLFTIAIYGLNLLLIGNLAWLLTARVLSSNESRPTWYALLAGPLAVLLFGLHPLRVEVLALSQATAELQATMFMLIAVTCHLHTAAGRHRAAGLFGVYAFGAVGMFTHPQVIVLPLVLLVLDAWPLRRLNTHAAWLEKIPLILLGLLAGLASSSLWGCQPPSDLLLRCAAWVYGSAFYLWKTVWPVGLAPIYETPANISPFALKYLLALGGVVLAGGLLLWYRRSVPALATCFAAYLLLIIPAALWLVPIEYTDVADRFSYLPLLPWTICLAGSVAWLLARPRAAYRAAGITLAVLLMPARRPARAANDPPDQDLGHADRPVDPRSRHRHGRQPGTLSPGPIGS